MYLFVYGTLKKGCIRNNLLDGQKFIRKGETKNHFRLFSNGSYPMLCDTKKKKGYPVKGEIYEVTDPNVIKILDGVEGVSYNLYQRREIKIKGFAPLVTTYVYQQEIDKWGTECTTGAWPEKKGGKK